MPSELIAAMPGSKLFSHRIRERASSTVSRSTPNQGACQWGFGAEVQSSRRRDDEVPSSETKSRAEYEAVDPSVTQPVAKRYRGDAPQMGSGKSSVSTG